MHVRVHIWQIPCMSVNDNVTHIKSNIRYVFDKKMNEMKSNLHGFELCRPTSKGTKSLFQVIKAIINEKV